MGIAVLVKGVTVRYETFGLETSRKWGVARITGKVSADFLPITSNRDDFLRDASEFAAFTITIVQMFRSLLLQRYKNT